MDFLYTCFLETRFKNVEKNRCAIFGCKIKISKGPDSGKII